MTRADGFFEFANYSAPTYIGSREGPRAGQNVVSLPLVGLSYDSLSPIGDSHSNINGSGVVAPYLVNVSYAGPDDTVFVRLAAWNASQFGVNISSVPSFAIGYSDVVQVHLSTSPFQVYQRPQFMQSAIVPTTVPESSLLVLAAVGAVAMFSLRRRTL